MAEVDVAHLEAGSFPRQAARPERRQAAAVGEARQRVHLVHELAELAGAEELLGGRDDRADVDQRLRRDGLDVLGGHALAHDTLHAAEADAHLVLDQLADGANAAVGEVILIVQAVAGLGIGQVQQVARRGEDFAAGEHRGIGIGTDQLWVLERVGMVSVDEVEAEQLGHAVELGPELAVQLVAAHLGQRVAALVEERILEVVGRGIRCSHLTRAHPLVQLEERILLVGRNVSVLFPLGLQEVEVLDEPLEQAGMAVFAVAERSQQREDAEATLAGHPAAGGGILARLVLDVELDPLAAVGVNGCSHQLVLRHVPEPVALAGLEDDTG